MAKDTRQKTGRRKGIRGFLTPGWVLTVVVVIAFTYFAFTVLAPWQLGKNTKQSEFNDRLKNAVEQEPQPIADILPADDDDADRTEHEWASVIFQGHFLPNKEVLLRSRPVQAQPAYQVLTPFETNGGLTVLVNRGWLPADSSDAVKVTDIPPAPEQELELTGYVRLGEGTSERGVLETDGREQTSTVNAAQIGESQNIKLDRDYVQLDEDAVATVNAEIGENDDNPHPVPLPQIESGPYLSYGIQWIAFGIIAPILFGWFIWSELKERRRAKEEAAELAVENNTADTAADADLKTELEEQLDPMQRTPQTIERETLPENKKETDLEARYGKSRRRSGFGFRKDDGGERF